MAVAQDITTLGDIGDLLGAAVLVLEVLARENQRAGAAGALNGRFPSGGTFDRVARTPGFRFGVAQACHLLDGLVGRAVFKTDGVVGVHEKCCAVS